MNDKFVVNTNEIGEIIVTDVETDRVYRYNDISKFFGLIRLLNEQQATIEQLQKSKDVKEFSALFNQSIALKREIKDLKEENEQLKNKLNKGL